jgi:hypothetical protein
VKISVLRRCDVRDLERGRDVDFGAATADQVIKLSLRHARAAVQGDGYRGLFDDRCDPLGVQRRCALVQPVRVPDGRREAVHAGVLDERDSGLDRVRLARGARSFLHPPDRLQLAFDIHPGRVGFVDDLGGLGGVFVNAECRAVEEHRIPALRNALADHAAVRAVIEVQGHGHGQLAGHLPERLREDRATLPEHGFHRRLGPPSPRSLAR